MPFDPDARPTIDLGLRCLECGYPLGKLPEWRCPECGREVVLDQYIPKGDFPAVILNGKEVDLTDDVVRLMHDAQIPYLEHRGAFETIYGMDLLTSQRRRLAVPRESYFEVIDLLRRHNAGETMADGGFEESTPDWTCSGCFEPNPGNFEICWNCGAARSRT